MVEVNKKGWMKLSVLSLIVVVLIALSVLVVFSKPVSASCNSNNICEPSLGEDDFECPADCGTIPGCGNDLCEGGETSANCPADCMAIPPSNTKPVATGVVISPSSPTKNNPLTCNYVYSDADSDPELGTQFTWIKNGVDQSLNFQVLSSALLTKDQSWVCKVTPKDGKEFGDSVASSAVVIQNIAPTVTLANNGPKVGGSTFTLTATGSDTDGDALQYRFDWTNDGTWDTTYASGNTATHAYTKGTYTAKVEVKDTSNAVASATTSVSATNNAPTLTSPGNKAVNENSPLAFSLSGSDVDPSDTLTYSSASLPSGATLSSAGAFSWTPGYDTVTTAQGTKAFSVTFTVSDGTATNSKTITITVMNVNRAPTQPASVTITPAAPVKTDSLSCSASGSTDPDNDAVTYAYSWYKNGVSQFSGQTVGSGNLTKNDVWLCNVIPSDYVTSGPAKNSSVTIQNIAPTVTLANNGPKLGGSTFTLTATGTDTDGDALQYRFDYNNNGTWTSFSSSNTATHVYAKGAYTAKVEVKDTSGAIATATTSVSATNNAPVLTNPGNKYVNESQLLTFTLSASDIDSDALTYSSTSLPANATLSSTGVFAWGPSYDTASTASPVTNYNVDFTVSDGTSTATVPITITVYNTNRQPTAATSVVITPSSPVKTDTLTCTGSGATDPDGDAVTYVYSWSKNDVYQFSGQTVSSSELVHGDNWTCSVMTQDYSLSGPALSYASVIIQNIAPTVSLVNDGPKLGASTFTLTATGSDIDDDALEYRFDWENDGTWDTSFSMDNYATHVYAEGTYTAKVEVTDGVANATATTIVTSTNNPPVIENPGDKSVDENSLLEFNLSASDIDNDLITYSVIGMPGSATLVGDTFSWTPDYDTVLTAEGTKDFVITFIANDEIASDNITITITVTNVNRAPVLDQMTNASVAENDNVQFTLSASDPDGDTLTYSAVGLSTGATLNANTGEFLWTSGYDQAGSYTIDFTVSDGSLDDTKSWTIDVANTNRLPVFDVITDKEVNESEALVFSVNATDLDGEALSYSVNASTMPDGSDFDGMTQTFSWTPDYDQEGVYYVMFSVDDGIDVVDTVGKITVYNTNRVPVLDAVIDQPVNEGDTLSFLLTGSDPDGNTLVYTVDGAPAGAVLIDNNFTYTPDFDVASQLVPQQDYVLNFTVSDGALTDSKIMMISVSNVNRDPVLQSVPVQNVDENSLLTFALDASDADGDVLTYSATGLPAGSSLNDSTGVFSWTPDYDVVLTAEVTKDFEINFTVSDGLISDTQTTTLTVSNVNRAPVWDEVPVNQVFDEDTVLMYDVNATDLDGDVLTYSVNDTSMNMDIDPST
ncbi:MAG: Ig-like domain-containing protein, partial [Candidatus Aenigmatarchaeota archaeon]